MDFVQRALDLAQSVLGSTSPNPAVGAVVLQGGRVVGEGATEPPGGRHAEVVALEQARGLARGARLYVTLEPCCHQGRTPPCTDAIIRAGVAEVLVAVRDPNPRVAGGGIAALEAAGVRVELGRGDAEATAIMEGYFRWVTAGVPLVVAKFAMSLDGKIATASGESQWITGESARRYAHELRRTADAVAVGVGTALQDDPRLTARDGSGEALDRQPLRVVVDSTGRLPATAFVLGAGSPGRTLVATASMPAAKEGELAKAGAEIVRLPGPEGRVDVRALLVTLGERGVTTLLVEGGGTLLASLFEGRLVDRVDALVAPVIIGGRDALTPVEGAGVSRLADALRLQRVVVDRLGEDVHIVGYVE